MSLSKESYVLVLIGMADLVTTILFIEKHGAQEANPLFQCVWRMGLFAFVLAKILFLLGPIMLIEWARRKEPGFALGALRTAMAVYLLAYGIGFLQMNGPAASAAEVARASRAQGSSGMETLPRSYLNFYIRGTCTQETPCSITEYANRAFR